ncbi:MAG: PhnE/PtxC family ABC transporter permease, partial [Actinomycetes bacterium]
MSPRQVEAGRARSGSRRLLGLLVVVGLVWSLAAARGESPALVNPGGWPQVRAFLAAAVAPETSPAFLRVVGEATLVTVAYAVLGTALALALGVLGAFGASATFWRAGRRRGHRAGFALARGALALPRGLHEAVWALLLVNLLGFDPLVAVLAIGLPYGAITAKVYADLLDEAPRAPYEAMLAAGASRSQALLYGLLPLAAGDLLSYAFYRLECAVRAAVVLGVIGAGGLGFELELSFSALRYGEMWTVIAALVVVCAAADRAGAAVRARLGRRDRVVRLAVGVTLALTVWSWVYLAVRPATLWSPRTLGQLRYLLDVAWPPALDTASLARLWTLGVQTFQMSLLAAGLAFGAGLAAAVLAARVPGAGAARRALGWSVRGLLLLARA